MKRFNLLLGGIVFLAVPLIVTIIASLFEPSKSSKKQKIETEIAEIIREFQREFPEGSKFIDELSQELAGAAAVREYRGAEEKLRTELTSLKVEKAQLERIVAAERAAVAEILRANNRAFEDSHKWDDEKSFLINVASAVFCSWVALLWVKLTWPRRESGENLRPIRRG